jgi:hypothetical protein
MFAACIGLTAFATSAAAQSYSRQVAYSGGAGAAIYRGDAWMDRASQSFDGGY